MMQNVVDLDHQSRKDALTFGGDRRHPYSFLADLNLMRRGMVNFIPILLLFDFAAAFPSVSHLWLMAVLRCIRIPSGILEAIRLLYSDNVAFNCSGNGTTKLFCILAGVLQGCPLSGSLFVVVLDPLLELFKLHIEDAGIGRVRACADDIGATLHHLQYINVLYTWFESFRKVSGLTLKPKKCNMILTVCSPSESTINIIREWFRDNCPAWCNFQVCDTAKYLGFFLGPKAGKKQWVAPLAKFSERYKEAAARGLPLGLVGPPGDSV